MKRQLPAWLALLIISAVAGLLLSGTDALTKERIATQTIEAANAARQSVLTSADVFEALELPEGSPLLSCYEGTKDGNVVGYVAQTSVSGYGGPIEVTTGIGMDNVITGVTVGGAGFSETPGLGAKTKDAKYTEQFKGLTAPVVNKQDVDSLSGATISSGAVVSGVNRAADYIKTLMPGYVPEETTNENVVNTVVVQAFGFAGPIEVSVGFDADSAIAQLDVGGDAFAETAGFGELAKEKPWRDQFIGKSGTLSYGDGLDAISGATITSTAVLDAVNEAIAQQQAAPPVVAEMTVKGFIGDIDVSVVVNGDGTIAKVSVGGDAFAETPGLGELVKENAFTGQFVGKHAPVAFGDGIDAVAGATISSNAVLDGINTALASVDVQSAGTSAPVGGEVTTEPVQESTSEPTPEPVVEKAPVAEAPEASGESKTVTVFGFAGNIDVTVQLDDAGAIANVSVGGANFAETPGLGAMVQEKSFTDQFVGKSGVLAFGDGIDAITSATISSDAVLDAVNQILAQ